MITIYLDLGSIIHIFDNTSDNKCVIPLALAVGMVPCPGIVIIMLFALSFDLLWTGIMISFIMALGMAAAISFAGLLSIFGHEGKTEEFEGAGPGTGS